MLILESDMYTRILYKIEDRIAYSIYIEGYRDDISNIFVKKIQLVEEDSDKYQSADSILKYYSEYDSGKIYNMNPIKCINELFVNNSWKSEATWILNNSDGSDPVSRKLFIKSIFY